MTDPIRIKTFTAKTLAEALQRIRKELGPDATILETKQTQPSRFSWSGQRVQVTASSAMRVADPPSDTPTVPSQQDDAPTQQVNAPTQASRDVLASFSSMSSDSRTDVPTPSARAPHSPELNSDSAATWLPEPYVLVANALRQSEVDHDVLRQWIDDAWHHLGNDVPDPWMIRAHIARSIRHALPVDRPTLTWSQPRTAIALIGPHGHGKSTAAAKLASMASDLRGLQPHIVAWCEHASQIDNRLSSLCRLMDWPLEHWPASMPYDPDRTAIAHAPFVVLDMSAIPMGDFEGMQRATDYLEGMGATQIHMTLTASTSPNHARRTMEWYRPLQPSHVLLTQLDESPAFGPLIPALAAARTPLGFASIGPNVPDDLVELSASTVARWILEGATSNP